LDIADLQADFDIDVPFNADDCVHRTGRTCRAGASGLAVTLVTSDDARNIGDIERLIKAKIELQPFQLEDDRPRRRRAPDDEAGRSPAALRRERSPERADEASPAAARPLMPCRAGRF
jgi:superfamily II DNA/RNA helicase